MTYSEDSATPAAPFSGDGSIFDHPDVLLTSPITTERVVDTQSGFLLVIRRMGERLALSCKRRVGTPPSSTIMLTPDESVKLSKILASSIVGLEDSAEDHSVPRMPTGGRRRFPFTPSTQSKKSTFKKFAGPLKIAGIAFGVVAVIAVSFGVGKLTGAPANSEAVDPLSTKNVDRFARRFVSEMLDFNPETYKLSQVQAMSYMTPELLAKYWQETNFPLSRRQLSSLPQGTTVMINRIAQERTDGTSATADIYAELVRTESKLSSPVHLKLKLGIGPENTIKVLEQEDLTAGAH